jgi:peptidoglycan/LPS O-acetylase OafA/YrhL
VGGRGPYPQARRETTHFSQGGDVKTRRLLRLIPALFAAAALALSVPGAAVAKHKHHHHHHHHNGQSSTPGYMY